MRSTSLRAAVLCALSALATQCKPGRHLTDPTLRARSESFNDHTVPRIEDVPAFQRLARNEGLLRAVKFIITDFNVPERRRLRFYDSNFFKLHDEWYWFRLLNGALVDGDETEPVQLRPFANIPDIYQWAAEQAEYPLDLVMYSDGRLYSPRFYDRAFGRGRRFGLGTLLSLPPAQGSTARRWAFELEFNDGATHEELMVFFAQLRAKLPAEIANDLHYLVRSQPQEALAQQMIRGQLTEHQRVLRYDQIVPAGTREVYSEGITAGYLRFVRANEGLPMSTPEQILVFERSPDLLPPAAGVITAVPQTPLAHINLLARNRGIPNAMLAGALEDPMLMQLARGYAAVVFAANVSNGTSNVSVASLTEEQMQRYRSMVERAPRRVNTPDPSRIPYVLDLSQQQPAQIPQLAASIGGKATGFIALTHTPGLAIPDRPLAITTRAYSEHVAPLLERIRSIIDNPEFDGDVRVRELVLEGRAKFRERHPQQADRQFADAYCDPLGSTTALGDLARADGLRGLIERTAIAPNTLAEIRRALTDAYGHLAPTQGIRFRSSSNAEDIEGFNGAGLYESFTGFLDPTAQPAQGDRNKSIERAIRKVWGSFWGFEAFEERRTERIDHLSAAMAIAVHPRFDDSVERTTGVCTFTILPPTSSDAASLSINVQLGAESVANPDPNKLPEVLTVIARRSDGQLRVERGRHSTLAPARDLMSDETARALFAQTRVVSDGWLARENVGLNRGQQRRSITLDFEFHEVSEGWPARRDGARLPPRLVLKQVRTLEPASRVRVDGVDRWPVPREVIARARRVERQRCEANVGPGSITIERLQVFTDRTMPPDVGYSEAPMDVEVTLELAAARSLGIATTDTVRLEHWQYTSARGPSGSTMTLLEPQRFGVDRVELGAHGTIAITRGARSATGTAQCRTELLFSTPADYLASVLAAQAQAR
ncbi:MAG: PEP/pyruvate-binding domain-containing protein [Polyangiales bacterium]